MMKAWFATAYGGPEVLSLRTTPVPVLDRDEILIRVHAASVSAADSRIRGLRLPRGFGLMGRLALGICRPRKGILGIDLSGVVEAIGTEVDRWRLGDQVVAMTGSNFGCHAEFVKMKAEAAIVPKPLVLGFEDAAALPFGGTTALYFLRQAALKPGESLLVVGASGAVGSAMVQLGRHMGAVVTAVTSTRNLQLVRALGAQAVIDRTAENFTRTGKRYDVIADTVGASSYPECLPALAPGGRYLVIAGSLCDHLRRNRGGTQSIAGVAPTRLQELSEVVHLAEQGTLVPVIDRVYGFADLPEAHALVDSGRKRGSVVVNMQQQMTV